MSNSAPESGREPRSVPPRMPANPPRIGSAKDLPTPTTEPLASPSVQVAGRDDAAMLDNYAEFIGRLETAAGKLTPRRDTLSAALDAAGLLLNQNNAGVELWGQRRTRIRQLLNLEAAKQRARTYRSLSELHEVAQKMEQMFSNRAQRVLQVCSGIRARRDQINAPLLNWIRARSNWRHREGSRRSGRISAKSRRSSRSPPTISASVSPTPACVTASVRRGRQLFLPRPSWK